MMAYSINAEIPLQAKQFDFGRGFDLMQQAKLNNAKLEEHKFAMQRLRDDYEAQKEARKQQKAMQMGIASDLTGIQSGSPAQYAPKRFEQTPQTGQMPMGMTGVLRSEQGQNLSQPQAFGEDILQGNFDVGGGEVTQEAVAGREPSYLEQLQIAAKRALQVGDVDSAFKYSQAIQQQRIAEREQNAPIGNPYPVYDTQGNFVGTYVMTKSGEVPFGNQGTTTVKPDVLTAKDKYNRAFEEKKLAADLALKAQEIELKRQELNTPKLDPVQRASDIADVKADAKVRQDLVNDAANVTKTYQVLNPLINNALTIVKKLPPDMLQSFAQSKLAGTPLNKYLGNKEQQQAITDYNLVLENLRLFIEKPAGAISNYEQGILGRAIGILEGNYSVEQKESALKQVKKIFDNQNAVAVKVLKQNKGDKFIFGNNQPSNAPLRFKKESTSQQRKEYADAIMAAQGDSEKINEIQEYARDIGVLE
jgi:hypothetical protein